VQIFDQHGATFYVLFRVSSPAVSSSLVNCGMMIITAIKDGDKWLDFTFLSQIDPETNFSEMAFISLMLTGNIRYSP